tara:strand:- start:316 stop:465 length:150 start_codon:yes stop_codon:yes gene_type:complete
VYSEKYVIFKNLFSYPLNKKSSLISTQKLKGEKSATLSPPISKKAVPST